MSKHYTLLLTFFVAIFFVSCQKELSLDLNANNTGTTPPNPNPPAPGALLGTWNFVNMQVQTKSTNNVSAGSITIKTVTESNYTTVNNGGSLTIDSATMTATNLTYAVDTRAYMTMYQNGVITDTLSMPMQSTIPVFTSTSAYTQVTSDSVYFQNGSVFSGGVSGNSQPSGARVSINQNKLTFSQHAIQSNTVAGQGTTTTEVTAVITFQK